MTKGINTGIESNGRELDVFTRFKANGIPVFTVPYLERSQYTDFAFNAENGIEMNIDAQFTGTPQLVHDGTDNVGWTGTNVSGSRVTFNSTNRPRTGSNSIYMNRPFAGDIWQFDKGSSFDPTAYEALTLWINVDNNWAAGDETVVYAYDTGTALTVGVPVNLSDYFTPGNFDIWQELVIPMSDLGVSSNTFDTLRMEVTGASGTRPRWYIDDMNWQEAGGAVSYKITPPNDKIFTVDKVQLTFIDAYAATLADNSVKNLSYNQILGVSKLSNGITLRRIQKGVTEFTATVREMADFTKGGGDIDEMYSDGTNTLVRGSVNFSSPVELDPRSNDCISITISDDLTGFISFTAIGRGNLRDIA